MLKEMATVHGPKWDIISKRGLPHLTPRAIKNKYYSMRRGNGDQTRYQKIV